MEGELLLIVDVGYSQVRDQQFQLIHKINPCGVLCEKAHENAKHHPTAIGDFVLSCPAEEPAGHTRLSRVKTRNTHVRKDMMPPTLQELQ